MPTYYAARIARIYLKLPSVIKKIRAIQQEHCLLDWQGVPHSQTPPLYRLEQLEPALLQNLAPTPLSSQEAAAVEQDATVAKQDATVAE